MPERAIAETNVKEILGTFEEANRLFIDKLEALENQFADFYRGLKKSLDRERPELISKSNTSFKLIKEYTSTLCLKLERLSHLVSQFLEVAKKLMLADNKRLVVSELMAFTGHFRGRKLVFVKKDRILVSCQLMEDKIGSSDGIQQLNRISIPIKEESLFHKALDTLKVYSGTVGDRKIIQSLGGKASSQAVVIPLSVEPQATFLLYCDDIGMEEGDLDLTLFEVLGNLAVRMMEKISLEQEVASLKKEKKGISRVSTLVQEGSSDLAQKELERVILESGDLPAMPHIAGLVMNKLSDRSSSARQVQKIISADQALAAKILKVANSAFYGCSRKVSTLTDAVVILGFNTIRSLVLAISTRSILQRESKGLGLSREGLWKHSIGCAVACRILGSLVSFPRQEEAFICGLLHDIGKLVLSQNFSQKYKKVEEKTVRDVVSYREAENEVFGFDHAQVGALLVRKWNFSQELERVIEFHHQPSKAQGIVELAAIANFSDILCNKLGIGFVKDESIILEQTESAIILNIQPAKISELEDKLRQALAEDELF